MTQTLCAPAPVANHRAVDCVAIEKMSRECVTLLLSARKRRAAPRDRRVHQLRRDVARGRAKPFETILRIAIADLEDGESLDDVLGPLWATMHFLEECAGQKAEREFQEYIRLETDLRSREQQLEVDYLLGDKSSGTLQTLDTTFAKHEQLLEDERSALHKTIYRSAVA